ncbi:MAG: type IV secretion system DNA-binding domain-containing protein [Patescibacteria group bacterium]|nr:type IV secretion system DNA-binding domain-containing protein [Patescibacteria group bacterium]MDE2218052.1 type IV secretion system DNA-binding domain-containing protein [Patescibacteria group bacterium]
MNDNGITYFAQTDARNKKTPFGIKENDRSRHLYVIGKTGMGKSTLLENMAAQDIQKGEGMAFIDPHGKTAELLLNYVPQERIKDVLYFAPFDMEYPITFNVMEDVGYDKRHLVVSGLMGTFKKIWQDAWSARMEYILSNTILALLEYPEATLLGVNRMLADKDYRKKVVDNIKDPSVKSFWVDEFAKYTDRFAAEATPAIQNKIGQFTSNPLIRNIVGQSKSSFDIRKIMDERKILIINLSKGRVGEVNANLLGSMLITKIYLGAMSRADASPSELNKLPNFYLYVDEFQSFANESFADILSEARKYKLSLTIAHQYIEQMSEEVRAAVFGNVGTMISFRVGAFDAEVLEKEFAPQFTAEDMVNLGFAQIYLKLMIDGVSSSPFSAVTLPPISEPEVSFKQDIIDSSRAQFAHPRAIVEEDIRKWHEPDPKPPVIPRAPLPKREFKPADKSFAPGVSFGANHFPASEGENKHKISLIDDFKRNNYYKKDNVFKSDNRRKVFEENSGKSQNDDFAPLKSLNKFAPPIAADPNAQNGISKKQINDKQARIHKPEPKKITEENKNLLKEALQSALKTAVPDNDSGKEKGHPQMNHNIRNNQPKEIPEETLRKILEIKE